MFSETFWVVCRIHPLLQDRPLGGGEVVLKALVSLCWAGPAGLWAGVLGTVIVLLCYLPKVDAAGAVDYINLNYSQTTGRNAELAAERIQSAGSGEPLQPFHSQQLESVLRAALKE